MDIVFVSLMVWTVGFSLDTFTTVYVLYHDKDTVFREANPMAKWIINHFGLRGFSIMNIIFWWAGVHLASLIPDIYFLSTLLMVGVLRLTAGISNYLLSSNKSEYL